MTAAPDYTVHVPSYDKIVNERFVDIFDNQDRYLILWGGRNSSKSVSCARKLIIRCISEKYFKCILIRKTYESIKDSQYETIKSNIEAMGLAYLFKFRKSPLEIECVNGNIFLARGLDKPRKLKSLKDPTCAWWEEPNDVTEDDFITVSTGLRGKAKYIQEILTLNPECDGDYEDFWLWQTFFKGHAEKSFSSSTEVKLPDGSIVKNTYTVHHSTYVDNRYITATQKMDLESWKAINPYYYTIYTLGEWGNREVGGRFWKCFDRITHVSDEMTLLPTALHLAFDENVLPYPALSIWQPVGKAIRQIHEVTMEYPNNKLVKVAREFVRWARASNWHDVVFLYGDSSSDREDSKEERGLNWFTMFRRELEIEGYSVRIRKPSTNPSVTLSADFINAVMEMCYDGLSIRINNTCSKSIADYLLAQEAYDGRMEKKKVKHPKTGVAYEPIGHFSDTMRYFITMAYKDSYRKYQKGIKRHTAIVTPVRHTKRKRKY